jgi:hypothetical protein
MEEVNEYEVFVKSMEEKYPKMLADKYGGFAIGKGWWIIVDKLMGQIQWHIDNSVKNNKWDLENDKTDVRPIIPQVTVAQIKEKFGGLRFYYDGGDEYIHGLVSMAESWAGIACEECGGIGERRSGGWIRTLCDKHETLYQVSKGNYNEESK